jgi:murein DD-endopeptidase MepM/ murein hydrolase activator NlpD
MRSHWINNTKYFSFLLLQIFISAQAFAGSNPINIESRHVGQDILILAHNNGNSPVSVKVSVLDAENFASDHSWPIYTVLPANSNSVLAKTFSADKTQGFSFKTTWLSMLGDFNASHDPNAVYRLPYQDGLSFPIGQAIGGPRTTHNTPDSLFAIDFSLPEGTPIVAARDGLVIGTEGSFSGGGKERYYMDKANFIRMMHSDGTTGIYAHLMTGGILVTPGQYVKAGTTIAYSGSTGFSSGPHLHFVVTHVVKGTEGFDDVSIPISFYVGRPAVIFEPKKDLSVKADYSNPYEPQANTMIAEYNQPPLAINPQPHTSTVLLSDSTIQPDSNTLLYIAVILFVLLGLIAFNANREKEHQRKNLESIREMFKR